MTTERHPPTLLRSPGGSQRATLLELFSDLVYVAALALTSSDLAGELTWSGALRSILPLVAVWWVWSITAITTDFYDPQRRPIQLILGAVMVGTILMAASLPNAFGDRGLVFACAYTGSHVVRGVILMTALTGGGRVRQRAGRFLFWFCVSTVPWIIGGFAHDSARALLWGFALAIDLVFNALRYPTPWLGRVLSQQYEAATEHLGERYQQFMILALGDMILVAVLQFARLEFTGMRTAALIVAFAITVLLWQIYVHHAGSLLQTVVVRNPGRSSRWAPFTHLFMVVGIVVTAAGFDIVIRRPDGHTPVGWIAAVFGGPILFLLGRTAFEYEVFGRASWTRLGWLVVLGAAAVPAVLLPPLYAATMVGAILLALAASDLIRIRGGTGRIEEAVLRRPPGGRAA
ncbi:low temperature requirement protein A [Rugosimonospora acidiphila]|uniref:Low temperature requirement protein A n=1 Tax=Rugosimonospora acidiphila TaxID=556531 RepID=A0ABP9SFW0_9ACTN